MLGFWALISLALGGFIGTIIAKLLAVIFSQAIAAFREEIVEDDD